MRDVIFGGGSSLDNYLARPDHAVDWLMWGKEAAAVTTETWKSIDTVLMGRKTYEAAVRMGQARGYPGVRNYVFSRTIEAPADSDVVVVREDAVGFVRDLKAQEGKSICLMGGGEFANSLFEADLIDVIGFNIHPVLLGAGIPVFHRMSRQIDLQLEECRAFQNGCVYVLYRVRHGTPE